MTSDIRQFNDPGSSGASWNDIVARGQQAKVPTALQRQDRHSVIYPSQTETLYEEENLGRPIEGSECRLHHPTSFIMNHTVHSNTYGPQKPLKKLQQLLLS